MSRHYDWKLIHDEGKGGHRLFRSQNEWATSCLHSGLAIADRSGPTPDTTDDGVLWINLNGKVVVGEDYTEIPVMHTLGQDDEEMWVVCSHVFAKAVMTAVQTHCDRFLRMKHELAPSGRRLFGKVATMQSIIRMCGGSDD